MTIPWRQFWRQHRLEIHYEGHDSDKADFEAAHSEIARLRRVQVTGPVLATYSGRYCIIRGDPADGWNAPGADKICDLEAICKFSVPNYNIGPITTFSLIFGYLYDDQWDSQLANGQTIDGVTSWAHYPPSHYAAPSNNNNSNRAFTVSNLPEIRGLVYEAYDKYTATCLALDGSPYILDDGLMIKFLSFTPGTASWWPTYGIALDIDLQTIIVRYFNAVCNSFAPNKGPSAGGWPLVFSGLGFHCDNDEALSKSGAANTPHEFDAWVYNIFIEKPDGTIVKTLRGYVPYSEYSIDSDEQITIAAMPALPAGIYQIRLHKHIQSDTTIHQIDAYAGDWRTDEQGRMTRGDRLYLYIYDEYKPPKKPIIRGRWTWKKGDLSIFRYYAPIDVRASLTFYEGMILDLSSFERGTNDLNGLPIFPDIDVELDNSTREFSKLLAEYRCKNQLVELWWGYEEEPEVFHELIFTGVVADYDRPGPTWKVKLRDIKEKYFSVDIPRYRCSIENFPNIHQNHNGRAMPEVLGNASLTSGAAPGAVEAIYVDTSAFEYLAARGSLFSISEVYSDGALVNPVDYEIVWKDGGRTYIDFVSDQGDAKITFNAQGYSFDDWDSANGYVQNPAYIILFLLAFFLEMPDLVVDIASFDALADLYDALGYGESGFLIVQENKRASEYLQELLFSFGAKLWTTADNKIKVARKDISGFSSGPLFFHQIDALSEPDRAQGFDQAVNYAPVRWGYYPTSNLFIGSKLHQRASSIAALEAEIMPSPAWDFLWIAEESFADLRAQEELLKLGFGEQKINLPISIEHHDEIDILENFRFQDPYGLNIAGEGDAARFYYVEKIRFDPMRGSMNLTSVDLQWLLRQYFVLGDEGEHPANWSAALDSDRMYGYLCDEATGLFSDGEPGKILVNEIEISS